MRILTLGVVAAALAACSPATLGDKNHATGSSSVAASADYSRVFVPNGDAGTLSVLDADGGGLLSTVDVGLDPVRVARAGDRVYVTARGTGEVVVFDAVGEGLTEVGRIPVGPDAFGLVASEKGDRLFVAVGMANQVLEIDTESDTIVGRFTVPDQPRWLGLHPSGHTLYVGSAFNGTWSSIDLGEGEVTTHTPPQRSRFVFDDDGEGEVVLTPRVTGDLTVSPYGDWVGIPVFYVDNITPVGNASGPTQNGGYASGPGVGRTNPTILVVETETDGDPKLERQRTVFAQGFVQPSGDIDELSSFAGGNVRSYISSLTADPSGLSILATMEGSGVLLAVPIEEAPDNRGRNERIFMDEMGGMNGGAGFEFVESITIASDAGPRGAVFTSRHDATVDTWLDRSAGRVGYREARDQLRRRLLDGDFGQGEPLGTQDHALVAPATLPPQIEEGRRLFFSATDSAMAAHSGGISCATCHFDGRNDGLTWTFDIGERQTPSLAGVVSETTPVTWTNDIPTVATEVRLTSRDRMGGDGASVSQSKDVEAFIDLTPFPRVALPTDADAIARGSELFFGEAQCASCHNGANYTDRVAYDMFGLTGVMTPTLRGIAATAPYGHDGRAETLRDLVENAEAWNMGKTDHLTEQQKDDLALFVSTL